MATKTPADIIRTALENYREREAESADMEDRGGNYRLMDEALAALMGMEFDAELLRVTLRKLYDATTICAGNDCLTAPRALTRTVLGIIEEN